MNKPVRARHAVPEVPVPAPVDRTLDDPSDPTLDDASDPKLVEVVPAVEPVVEPAAEPAPEPAVELPELRYEYQPTDTLGRALGGKQVIKYHTPDELPDKLRDQNIELVRKLREVTRKQTLGITDDVKVPDEALRFESFVELTPRELSAEERFNLSQDLNDPAKAVEAINELFKANIGASPDELRKMINTQQLTLAQMQAKSYYDLFEKQCTEFCPCAENKQILTDWMVKKGLAPTVTNFNLAFSTLKEAGLLLDNPIVREVTPAPEVPPVPPVVLAPSPAESTEPKIPQAPAVPESRITPAEQPQAKRQVKVPSGLNSSNASDSISSSGVTANITLSDIDDMPSEVYRKKLKDPAFRKLVDDLEKQAATRRANVNV